MNKDSENRERAIKRAEKSMEKWPKEFDELFEGQCRSDKKDEEVRKNNSEIYID